MNIRKKVFVDRMVGLPLAWMLNGAARILGKLLRRDHSIGVENIRTIVIAKYVGMGSILQATPLIRSLRSAFPHARIILVTGRTCRRLAERLEHIDAIITVDDRSMFHVVRSTLHALGSLIRAKVDLFFDLEVYSAYASIMSLLSLSRNRIGFYRESAEHKIGIYTHLMYFNTRSPIRCIYLQLGRTVGCEPVGPDRLGRIRVDAADREEVVIRLSAAGVEQERYIVVNPNASDLMLERRWPGERFAALINRMIELHDLPVVLIGSPAERPTVTSVAERVSDGRRARVVNLAGELSLGGLFALLDEARCVITNDTGPMHMAWALGTPTVCLFGPVDPAHYGWAGPGVEILYERIYCSPCVHEVDEPPCKGNNVCMQRIGVDEVLSAVKRILTSPPPNNIRSIGSEFFVDPFWGPLGFVVRGSIKGAPVVRGSLKGAPCEGSNPRGTPRSDGQSQCPLPRDRTLELETEPAVEVEMEGMGEVRSR